MTFYNALTGSVFASSSVYVGTNSRETLNNDNWDYDWTTFFMKGGDDVVDVPNTGLNYYFDGGSGGDYFLGGSGADTAYGSYGYDTLNGWSGNDRLYGGIGKDTLNGGSGRDHLDGGAANDTLRGSSGSDYLTGGAGRDTLSGGNDGAHDYFIFSAYQSNPFSSSADTITDWNGARDFIELPKDGSFRNYEEAVTRATTIEQATSQANIDYRGDATHVFLYNPSTDTGYLLSDLVGGPRFDSGIILRGAGADSDFSYNDIM